MAADTMRRRKDRGVRRWLTFKGETRLHLCHAVIEQGVTCKHAVYRVSRRLSGRLHGADLLQSGPQEEPLEGRLRLPASGKGHVKVPSHIQRRRGAVRPNGLHFLQHIVQGLCLPSWGRVDVGKV